jgi:hypothetical protein
MGYYTVHTYGTGVWTLGSYWEEHMILFCACIPFAAYVSFHEDTIERITIQAWILKKLSFLQLHHLEVAYTLL